MTPRDAQTLIAEIRKLDYKTNDWEEKFLQNISRCATPLSAKQSKALMAIYEKAVGGGKYQGREYIKKKW